MICHFEFYPVEHLVNSLMVSIFGPYQVIELLHIAPLLTDLAPATLDYFSKVLVVFDLKLKLLEKSFISHN
jgi:hypothetical protein